MKNLSLALTVLVMHTVAFSQRTIPPDKAALLRGDGMGLAAAAEFNGFPGPKHVLELADTLGLTPDQTSTARELMEAVQVSARIVGADVVRTEGQLDSLFAAGGTVAHAVLDPLLKKIALLRAELRKIHLDAHIRMREILTAGQVELYNRLRGYES